MKTTLPLRLIGKKIRKGGAEFIAPYLVIEQLPTEPHIVSGCPPGLKTELLS